MAASLPSSEAGTDDERVHAPLLRQRHGQDMNRSATEVQPEPDHRPADVEVADAFRAGPQAPDLRALRGDVVTAYLFA